MRRWNIANIFFLGVAGEMRDIPLMPGMNIITGASGTGKSTLIKAIDYCLGSSRCELAARVRRSCLGVGVKWTSGDVEMISGRVIPPVGQTSSTRMFTTSGRNLRLPLTLDDFQGPCTVEVAKAYLERAFGIGDLPREPLYFRGPTGRATVRHVAPYIFVSKEVIDSESILLHGMEKADKVRDLVATLPYFLGATDEMSAVAERQLRRLRRSLDAEDARERARSAVRSAWAERAHRLLLEGQRLGLLAAPMQVLTEEAALATLEGLTAQGLAAPALRDGGEIDALHQRRRERLEQISDVRRQLQATRRAETEASGFGGAVVRQREKLMLSEHLQVETDDPKCPVCSAPSERGAAFGTALRMALHRVREESAAVERVKPQLHELGERLQKEVQSLSAELRAVDDAIRDLVRQTVEGARLADLSQARAHLLGRISFFLEASADGKRESPRDMSVVRSEIAELEARLDRQAVAVKIRRAESKVSQYATEAFSQLPTVDPCTGAELDFSSQEPELTVIEGESGAVLRMSDIGSDQNYLAVHIALSFALQRFLQEINAPVPGVLVLDQISRPYFPNQGEDSDEREIAGGSQDEDVQAMRKHIDFLFAETARRPDLQVILIEHAYFADDPRYTAATRQRWTRASGEALVPKHWATRPDDG